jgi:hypothetical protein
MAEDDPRVLDTALDLLHEEDRAIEAAARARRR